MMLCLAQDEIEVYVWGGDASYSDVWREIYINSGYNGNKMMQMIRDDLDTYLKLGTSTYEIVWIDAEYVYEQYASGELEQRMSAEEYQSFIDKMNGIKNRLGIIYSSPSVIPQ